jgi:hypothetical protein
VDPQGALPSATRRTRHAWSAPCRVDANPHPVNKSLPAILLIVGLLIVGYGLMKKDDGQAEIDLGKTEITLGKSDSAFNGYFILGGLIAAAGLVMLITRKKG